MDEEAAMYFQKPDGTFEYAHVNKPLWYKDKRSEDINALFFDADNDGDLDLYVVSGGYELERVDGRIQDRLYINEGEGRFKRQPNLPSMKTSGKSVTASDFDNDGDLDLFVGGNIIPGKYPLTPTSYLLENNNGKFTDVTETKAKGLSDIGIINDAKFIDVDNDNDKDLVIAGEWIPVTVFKNNNGTFEKSANPAIDNLTGWFNSIVSHDFDNDGDQDLIVGNLGNNNKFHPSEKKPLHVYGKDFDKNGTFDIVLSKMYKGKLVPVRGKVCSSEQNPFLLDKIQSYKEFATSDMEDIYGSEELADAFHRKATKFETVYLENDGSGQFNMKDLNIETQFGPTLAMELADVNNDGHMDVLGVGNLFNAEVETIRYDASKGFVLLGDSKGNFTSLNNTSFYNNMNSKDIKNITINNKSILMVANNNAPLELYEIIH